MRVTNWNSPAARFVDVVASVPETEKSEAPPYFLVDVHDASNAEDKAGAVAAGINPADTKVEGAVQDDVTAFKVHL